MARIFISYSHADDALKVQLEKHLAWLRRSGQIEIWNDRRILPGEEFAGRIDENLEAADIILLLVSHNFMDSDYCFEIEMARALERHERGEARVVPVILDHCMWHASPFGKLSALPDRGQALTKFANINEGLTQVAEGISRILGEMKKTAAPIRPAPSKAVVHELPRSSNLHVKREFTERDKDRYVIETFDYIGRYFEGSLVELEKRSQGLSIETHFEKIDAATFTAKIYNGGALKAVCTVNRRKGFGGEINYSRSEDPPTNSINDSLRLEIEDGVLGFKPLMGFSGFVGRSGGGVLSQEGAAEYYWDIFFEPLKH